MLNLTLAMLCSALVSVAMRLGAQGDQPRKPMLAVNYLTCFAVSLFFLRRGAGGTGLGTAAGLGLLGGILYLGAFLLLQRNVRDNGVALSSLFMKLGVIVPAILGVTVFHERLAPTRAAGIVLTLAVVFVLFGGPDARGLRRGGLRGLVPLLLCSGMADGLSKVYNAWGDPALEGHFLCCVFGFALILSAILCLRPGQRPAPRDALYGLMLGLPNYFSSRFLLLALHDVPASIAYPVYACGTILLAAASGRLLFSERIGKRQCAALALALVALVLLNV